MKIATWNVKSLTARLQHVMDWTGANRVDLLCLQELKMPDDKFPLEMLQSSRLRALRRVRPEDRHGVAILSRHPMHSVDLVGELLDYGVTPVDLLLATLDLLKQPGRKFTQFAFAQSAQL